MSKKGVDKIGSAISKLANAYTLMKMSRLEKKAGKYDDDDDDYGYEDDSDWRYKLKNWDRDISDSDDMNNRRFQSMLSSPSNYLDPTDLESNVDLDPERFDIGEHLEGGGSVVKVGPDGEVVVESEKEGDNEWGETNKFYTALKDLGIGDEELDEEPSEAEKISNEFTYDDEEDDEELTASDIAEFKKLAKDIFSL